MTEEVKYCSQRQLMAAMEVIKTALAGRCSPIPSLSLPVLVILTTSERVVFLMLDWLEPEWMRLRIGAQLAQEPPPVKLTRQAINWYWSQEVRDTDPNDWVKIRNWNPQDEVVFHMSHLPLNRCDLPALIKSSSFARWLADWVVHRVRPTRNTTYDQKKGPILDCPVRTSIERLGERTLRVTALMEPRITDLIEGVQNEHACEF